MCQLQMLARAWSKMESLVGYDNQSINFTSDKQPKDIDQVSLKHKKV